MLGSSVEIFIVGVAANLDFFLVVDRCYVDYDPTRQPISAQPRFPSRAMTRGG
jgi:hypothetical protein